MANDSILAGMDTPAVAAKVQRAPAIQLQLPLAKALQLVGTIQLALRHPSYQSTDIATDMALLAVSLETEILHRVPELAPVLAAGWDPRQDS